MRMSGDFAIGDAADLEAEILRAADRVAQEPQDPRRHYDLGRLLAEASRPKDAERCFVRCVKLAPAMADAHHDLGVVLRAQGRFDDALLSYTNALAVDPKRCSTWINIGLLHAALERHDLAQAAFRSALEIDPGSAKAWNNLGLSLQAAGHDEEAASAFERAAKADPGDPGAAFNLGLLHERRGRFADAAALYRETLRREPAHALARANLVELSEPGDPAIAEAEAIVESGSAGAGDQALLQYALAKHLDRHGAYKQAWVHGESANRLRQSIAGPFDAGAQRELIARLKTVFSEQFFKRRSGCGDPGTRPVFIVGMPRSGTTLLEQILASHPQVHGAGELEHFALDGQDYPRLFDLASPFPECVGELASGDVKTLAQAYLGHLAALDGDAAHITNKTPLNFLRVGLIKLLFPNAAILHCRRDPRDSLLSIYFQNFAVQQTFSTDLEALGHYYLGYREIMAHWTSLFAETILDIDYQDIARDPAPSIRRVLDFLGLPWDDACLAFHETQRRVDTPSLRQVRQPIYKSSLERWKHYEDELQPLLKILGPVLEEQS